jgi:hypothetical protein
MRRVSRRQTVSRGGTGDLYSCEISDVLGGALNGVRFGVLFHQH